MRQPEPNLTDESRDTRYCEACDRAYSFQARFEANLATLAGPEPDIERAASECAEKLCSDDCEQKYADLYLGGMD